MRSLHSGLLAGVLGWGSLYRADTVIPLGAFEVVTGVALGVAALPVLRGVGIGFHRSKDWQTSFWCSPRLLVGGIGFSVRLRFSLWVVWLFHGWHWLPGVTLGVFLVHCLVLCGRL